MLNWLNTAALPCLIVMIAIAIWFRRKSKLRRQIPLRKATVILAVLGVGAWVLTFHWYLNSETRVFGFPFTSAIFQLENGRWVDYVGAITIPAMVANFIFWLCLFQLPLMWYKHSKSKPQQDAGGCCGDHRD